MIITSDTGHRKSSKKAAIFNDSGSGCLIGDDLMFYDYGEAALFKRITRLSSIFVVFILLVRFDQINDES